MKLEKLMRLDKIVEQILKEDPLAREDDCYLILKVVQKTHPDLVGTTFANVMIRYALQTDYYCCIVISLILFIL